MEWKTTLNKVEANENLKNTIAKSNQYQLKGGQYRLKFTQYLYETSIGFEIPTCLL